MCTATTRSTQRHGYFLTSALAVSTPQSSTPKEHEKIVGKGKMDEFELFMMPCSEAFVIKLILHTMKNSIVNKEDYSSFEIHMFCLDSDLSWHVLKEHQTRKICSIKNRCLEVRDYLLSEQIQETVSFTSALLHCSMARYVLPWRICHKSHHPCNENICIDKILFL